MTVILNYNSSLLRSLNCFPHSVLSHFQLFSSLFEKYRWFYYDTKSKTALAPNRTMSRQFWCDLTSNPIAVGPWTYILQSCGPDKMHWEKKQKSAYLIHGVNVGWILTLLLFNDFLKADRGWTGYTSHVQKKHVSRYKSWERLSWKKPVKRCWASSSENTTCRLSSIFFYLNFVV